MGEGAVASWSCPAIVGRRVLCAAGLRWLGRSVGHTDSAWGIQVGGVGSEMSQPHHRSSKSSPVSGATTPAGTRTGRGLTGRNPFGTFSEPALVVGAFEGVPRACALLCRWRPAVRRLRRGPGRRGAGGPRWRGRSQVVPALALEGEAVGEEPLQAAGDGGAVQGGGLLQDRQRRPRRLLESSSRQRASTPLPNQ